MKRKDLITNLVAVLLFFSPVIVRAQPPDPGPDADVPIDGGLSLLLAAGIGYVAKKGYDKRHNKRKKQAEFNEGLINK